MVTSVGIEETHPVMLGSGVDHLVNLWEREAVLGAGFVEVGEIHADPPFPTLLLDHHRVGQLVRVSDYLGFQQLLNFLDHGLGLWNPRSTSFLDHGLCLGSTFGLWHMISGLMPGIS